MKGASGDGERVGPTYREGFRFSTTRVAHAQPVFVSPYGYRRAIRSGSAILTWILRVEGEKGAQHDGACLGFMPGGNAAWKQPNLASRRGRRTTNEQTTSNEAASVHVSGLKACLIGLFKNKPVHRCAQMVHRTAVCFAENGPSLSPKKLGWLDNSGCCWRTHPSRVLKYKDGPHPTSSSHQKISSAFRDNKMASFEPTSPELSARDVLTFSDAELVQFMEQNRRPDGGFDLDVAGWDSLPKDQREKLAERLKYRSSL